MVSWGRDVDLPSLIIEKQQVDGVDLFGLYDNKFRWLAQVLRGWEEKEAFSEEEEAPGGVGCAKDCGGVGADRGGDNEETG